VIELQDDDGVTEAGSVCPQLPANATINGWGIDVLQEVENNPCLVYVEKIIMPWFGKFEVKRPPQFGGDKTYTSFEQLKADYQNPGSGKEDPNALSPRESLACTTSSNICCFTRIRIHQC
jgi:hypothetical protein